MITLIVATDRASGAAQAKDQAARVRQLNAGAGFARTAAQLIAASPQLDLRLARALSAARFPLVFSAADLSRGRAHVAKSGLSRDVVAALRRFGISDSGIHEFTQEVAHQSVTGRVNVAGLLASRSLALQQRTTANGFLERGDRRDQTGRRRGARSASLRDGAAAGQCRRLA